jgi:pyridoxamine 5'-phosphate oxidase
MNLEEMRREYTAGGLRRKDLKTIPFDQFTVWFEQAAKCGEREPNAMTLATVSPEGRPFQRTVLLKQFDERGFVFFTNFESRKAQHIEANSNVSLLFPWLLLERQVIINGQAERISTAEAMKYFIKRPLESQIGAWASPQSRVIESRKFLELKIAELKRKFVDGKVPLPSFWGGFRVVPEQVEFWQGGAGRVHDRFVYARATDGSWTINRLAP